MGHGIGAWGKMRGHRAIICPKEQRIHTNAHYMILSDGLSMYAFSYSLKRLRDFQLQWISPSTNN